MPHIRTDMALEVCFLSKWFKGVRTCNIKILIKIGLALKIYKIVINRYKEINFNLKLYTDAYFNNVEDGNSH